jgi:hypothetical protein
MPPKAKAVSDAPVVRRPRAPTSDDPDVEKRREQNRLAGATFRAKAKAEKERKKAGASTSLASIAEGSPAKATPAKATPAKAKVIINKPISQAFKEKMSEEDAKNIISRALVSARAKEELGALKYQKKLKELQEQSQKWVDYHTNLVVENNKLAYVYIKVDINAFKKYIGESYPEYLEIIERYEGRNVKINDYTGNKMDGGGLYLKYKPTQDYDYFVFSYKSKDGSITDKEMKISYTADVRFSTYLQNQFWRYDYYKVEESEGRFNQYSLSKTYMRYDDFDKKFKDGIVSFDKAYPALEFDQLEVNTDKIKEVPENKHLVRSRNLEDLYYFYTYEDFYWKRLEKESNRIYKSMLSTTRIYDKDGDLIRIEYEDDDKLTEYYDKKGNKIPNPDGAQSAPTPAKAKISSSRRKTNASSVASNISNVSNTPSIKAFLRKIKKEIDEGKKPVPVKVPKKRGKAQTAPVNMASSSVASSSVASSTMASSNASSTRDSDYASNWSSTNATSIASSSVATNGSLWGANSSARNIVAI